MQKFRYCGGCVSLCDMIAFHQCLTVCPDDDSVLRTLLIVPIRQRFTRIHIDPIVSRVPEIALALS